MRKQFMAILKVLLLVVLLIPAGGCLSAPEIYPVGIVVDVDISGVDLHQNGHYFIDIVVLRSEVSEILTITPLQRPAYHTGLYNSVYADRDNEWVSATLYLDESFRKQFNDDGIIFYSHLTHVDQIPFSQYKVVVYYDLEEPAVSSVFETSDSAMYDNPAGYKTVYFPASETFERVYYEAEVEPAEFGTGNSFIYFIIVVFVVLISAFVLMESFIYLVARQGWRAVVITLGFNVLVFFISVMQTLDMYGKYNMVFLILGMIFVPVIYAIKILLMKKHAPLAYKISILISVVYYAIYFYYTAMLMA